MSFTHCENSICRVDLYHLVRFPDPHYVSYIWLMMWQKVTELKSGNQGIHVFYIHQPRHNHHHHHHTFPPPTTSNAT